MNEKLMRDIIAAYLTGGDEFHHLMGMCVTTCTLKEIELVQMLIRILPTNESDHIYVILALAQEIITLRRVIQKEIKNLVEIDDKVKKFKIM